MKLTQMNSLFFNIKWGMLLLYLTAACNAPKKLLDMNKDKKPATEVITEEPELDNFLEKLMAQQPQQFKSLLDNKKKYNLQIIFTQIDRGNNQAPKLKNYYFNFNKNKYFYPASTVKLPIAILALQRLNELKDKGIDKYTTMITEAAHSGQTAVYNDPTSPDGKPSIAHYIKKILLVSDNDAYNRLYEFLGQEYINRELNKKGYAHVQILHRLEISLTENENRATNPIVFLDGNGKTKYKQELQKNATQYAKRTDTMGIGFYKSGVLINEPMDFSKKNRLALDDLHAILTSIVFPGNVKESQRFNITEDDRAFLLKYMSQLPTESRYPPYADAPADYWPAYCKFLLLGSEKTAWPQQVRIFNKVGDAYGQLIDAAYVVDFDKKIEFMLSAVIYCNEDGILNDNKYDYDKVGFPFMKNLGKLIYDHELKRKKEVQPDLSAFQFVYDK